MRKTEISVFSIISTLTLLWWQRNQLIDMEQVKAFWGYYPNSHRMFSQLLLFMHDNPLHFVNLVAVSFLISMFLTYRLLDLKNEQLLIFLLAVAWLIWGGYFVYCAPMYPVLAYIYKSQDWRVVPLLALIKEHAVIIAIFYFVFKKEYKKAVYSTVVSCFIYAVLFLMISYVPIPDHIALIKTIERMMLYPRFVFNLSIGFFIIMFLLYPFSRFEKKLILTNIIIILGFGLFWEFQLWMPLVVLFLLNRRKEAD